ncbi:MAG: Mth938-like domain-containing protein [Chlamydiota bacterium]
MIEEYSFGYIVVDGQEFSDDIVIHSDGSTKDSWWRSEGHRLVASDIPDVISEDPELIVVGTGSQGAMEVDSKLVEQLQQKDIEVLYAPTEEAVKIYNRLLQEKHKVAGCFHLTC